MKFTMEIEKDKIKRTFIDADGCLYTDILNYRSGGGVVVVSGSTISEQLMSEKLPESCLIEALDNNIYDSADIWKLIQIDG